MVNQEERQQKVQKEVKKFFDLLLKGVSTGCEDVRYLSFGVLSRFRPYPSYESNDVPRRSDGKFYYEMLNWEECCRALKYGFNHINLGTDEYSEKENRKIIEAIATHLVYFGDEVFVSVIPQIAPDDVEFPHPQILKNIAEIGIPLIPLLSIYDDSAYEYVVRIPIVE